MRITVARLRKEEPNEAMHIPTIIGGGFIDEKVRKYVGSDYWGADAVAGVEICSAITKSFA
jgi:methanogenic corrinoid protein MtbC1